MLRTAHRSFGRSAFKLQRGQVKRDGRFVFPADILPRILERNSTALKAFSRRAGTARDLEPVDRELKILLGIQMLQRACISVCRARWDLARHENGRGKQKKHSIRMDV
jgi:hypothetical protein